VNVRDAVASLTEGQQKALNRILRKLSDGKRLSTSDVGLLGFDKERCLGKFICEAFDITRPTIKAWHVAGCPRNEDGTYNLRMVIEWRVNQEAGKVLQSRSKRESLERRKLQKDIEIKDLLISKRKGEVIARDDHLMILGARASALRRFWQDSFLANLYHFADKSLTQLKPVAEEFVKQGMGAYLNASKSLEQP
jgi:hypothetical protein